MTAIPTHIRVKLLSAGCPASGRGSSASGVDIEVEHDTLGLPFVRGTVLRSLLHETSRSMGRHFPEIKDATIPLFGLEKSLADEAILRIDDAKVAPEIWEWVEAAIFRRDHPLQPADILRSMTETRFQTGEERKTGAPKNATLRSVRTIFRETQLYAQLRWTRDPSYEELCALSMAMKATRHLGVFRNRGLGYVQIEFGNPS